MEMKRYVAVVGLNHYFGRNVFRLGTALTLIKEADNPHDGEAIKVEIDPVGQVGYVANSTNTVPLGCQSAGRIYDTFCDSTFGVVRFVLEDTVIAEIPPIEIAILESDEAIEIVHIAYTK